jgi:hypothetical protein
MFVDDGLLKFVVQEMGSDYVLARAANGGMLGSRKGVDIPDAAMDLPPLSQKDLGACQWTNGPVGGRILLVAVALLKREGRGAAFGTSSPLAHHIHAPLFMMRSL